MHGSVLGTGLLGKRRWLHAAAFGLALVCSSAQASVTLKIVPALQLVVPGSSARFQARVEGTAWENDVIWEVLDQDQIKLDKDGWRGARFEVPAGKPWTRIAVRATSAEDSSVSDLAYVEILPEEPFRLIGRVLGENWLRDATTTIDTKASTPLQVKPYRLAFTPTFDISAETEGLSADRLHWSIFPSIGSLAPVQESKRSGKQTVKFMASWLRLDDHDLTVTLEHLDHPGYRQQVQIRVPKTWLADLVQ